MNLRKQISSDGSLKTKNTPSDGSWQSNQGVFFVPIFKKIFTVDSQKGCHLTSNGSLRAGFG